MLPFISTRVADAAGDLGEAVTTPIIQALINALIAALSSF